MIRKIPVRDLLPGMYVVDLHQQWFNHMLLRTRFKIKSQDDIRRLIDKGILDVSIDTAQGIDLPAPAPKPAPQAILIPPAKPVEPVKVSLSEERRRAARLLQDAGQQVEQVLLAAQAGRNIEFGTLEPIVERMQQSVLRNPDALIPLTTLKRQGAYLSEHAVATTAMMLAFGKHQAISESELQKLALGSLLKDIGQAAIDTRLSGQRRLLTGAEYTHIQRHVEQSLSVLGASNRLADTAISVIQEHHERFDGTGYPFRVAGKNISAAGRMAAITDTYDAITSERPYRAAQPPAMAMKYIYQQGGRQFDPDLIIGFVRSMGIYPVGSLIRLESGHLGIVVENDRNALLTPVVRVIYNTRHHKYIEPVEVDLARKFGNHYGAIISAESFQRWGINPQRWQPN